MCVGRYARLVVRAKEETPVAQTFPVSVATHPNSYTKYVSQVGVFGPERSQLFGRLAQWFRARDTCVGPSEGRP